MKNIVIIGGSKGIGNAILLQQLEKNLVHNISRNPPEVSHPNLTHYSLDVLGSTPQIENIDTLIYCPGSINLKPIGSLSIEDFRNDFEINVIGAVKTIQKYLPVIKKELILRLYCLVQLP
jgi:NAD(P)-dependent dehydrogenase (short-subunit alcohol dehydrogenase family)